MDEGETGGRERRTPSVLPRSLLHYIYAPSDTGVAGKASENGVRSGVSCPILALRRDVYKKFTIKFANPLDKAMKKWYISLIG